MGGLPKPRLKKKFNSLNQNYIDEVSNLKTQMPNFSIYF